MLHSIKRHTVGRHDAKQEPVNSGFETYRTNLENVRKALATSLDDIVKSETSWNVVVSNMEKFSSDLYTLYPQGDEMRPIFKSTVDEVVEPLSKEITEVTGPRAKISPIVRMIRAYLSEIDALTGEYGKVDKARKDYAMYTVKTDKLEQKDAETSKVSRNLDKKEEAKATYDSLLDGTLHRMKTTYEKCPTMFKAAHVAFWLYQDSTTKLLNEKCRTPFAYASVNCDTLFN